MNILITGAFGHIGSLLLKRLINKKNIKKIIIIDNFKNSRYNSFIDLKKKKIKVFAEDVRKFNFEKIKYKIHYIIHLAAITNAERSFSEPKKFINHNFKTTISIAKFAKNKNIKFIFASSTSVYGNQFKIITSENNEKNLLPQSPYAFSKIKEEKFIRKNLQFYCILRFGTIAGYSNGIRFHTAINKFCFQASMNHKLTIWKKFFLKKRPYLEINDCINSIIFIINKNLFQKKLFDVVSENLTVKNILIFLRKIKNIKIEMVKTKILNQFSYEVSSSLIIKEGFKFNGKIKNSIKEIMNKLNK
jgi:nucleoside-diphosphate-sugar epimerase